MEKHEAILAELEQMREGAAALFRAKMEAVLGQIRELRHRVAGDLSVVVPPDLETLFPIASFAERLQEPGRATPSAAGGVAPRPPLRAARRRPRPVRSAAGPAARDRGVVRSARDRRSSRRQRSRDGRATASRWGTRRAPGTGRWRTRRRFAGRPRGRRSIVQPRADDVLSDGSTAATSGCWSCRCRSAARSSGCCSRSRVRRASTSRSSSSSPTPSGSCSRP